MLYSQDNLDIQDLHILMLYLEYFKIFYQLLVTNIQELLIFSTAVTSLSYLIASLLSLCLDGFVQTSRYLKADMCIKECVKKLKYK